MPSGRSGLGKCGQNSGHADGRPDTERPASLCQRDSHIRPRWDNHTAGKQFTKWNLTEKNVTKTDKWKRSNFFKLHEEEELDTFFHLKLCICLQTILCILPKSLWFHSSKTKHRVRARVPLRETLEASCHLQMFDLVESLHLLQGETTRYSPERNLVKNGSVMLRLSWENCSQWCVWRIFCDDKRLWTSGEHMFNLVIRYIKDQCTGVNGVRAMPSYPHQSQHFQENAWLVTYRAGY